MSTYPPFSTWDAGEVPEVESILTSGENRSALGLYVHLPFCLKKCDYCYYLSFTDKRRSHIDKYLETLLEELKLFVRRTALRDRSLAYVYFGGGTPSILKPEQIVFLAEGINEILPWAGVREVTFECSPKTVCEGTVTALRDVGVTRVSMGVQSFINRLLHANGRIHLHEDILRAYELLRQGDFEWVNLDLMTGLVGESWQDWRESVRQAIALQPESVTIYQTEIPHNTELFRELQKSRAVHHLVPWDEKRRRLDYGFEMLEDAKYMVANAYAAVRYPARHRFVYQDHLWRGGDMLGLGVSSYSYVDGVHFQNVHTLNDYETMIQDQRLPLRRALRLNTNERLVREFILRLKTGRVSVKELQEKFKQNVLERFSEPLAELAEQGYLKCSEECVELTRSGLLCVDALTPGFYQKKYRGLRYS